ncbi:MAG: exopolyphosphatase [Paracoccaceae bacterium]
MIAAASAPGQAREATEPLSPMARYGVVDVGSNSVRLVVFDGVARAPAYFYNEKVLCGLGAGLRETGCLNPDGRRRALAALHRFVALAGRMKLGGLTGVATAAVREAADGAEFCAEVGRETGLELTVASGEEEARLSAQGVLLGWPHANGIVSDMGGSSMELARLDEGRIGDRATSPLGPLTLSDLHGGEAGRNEFIGRTIAKLRGRFSGPVNRLFLVGGSWRAIARLDMERRRYPLKVLHEYEMPASDILETIDWIAGQTGEDLSARTDTSMARLSLVPAAAPVLAALVRYFEPAHISVSSYGIREGLLYEKMPPDLRARDPLLEAARHMEEAYARFPGFGDALYNWLLPIYRDEPDEEMRLILAACRLHDITWRTHPDYRAEMCFESVTRANVSGVDHLGRVFLGVAILKRYKNGDHAGVAGVLKELLPPERFREAETLGKAMRLGAMLSGAVGRSLRDTTLEKRGAELVLTLCGPAVELAGEVVERRLASLAANLKLAPRMVLEEGRPDR